MTLLLNGVTPPLYQNIPPRRLFLSRSCCCLVSSSRSTALLLPDCPRLPATMSVVWLAVFATLCVELVFTAVLVAPLPIVIRNGIARFIYHHKIGDKLSFFLRFATLALMFAVWDSVQDLQRLEKKYAPSDSNASGPVDPISGGNASFQQTSFDRQRKFRAERNLYLSGMTLTLLFVIRRLVEMSNESAISLEAITALETRLNQGGSAVTPGKVTTLPDGEKTVRGGVRKRANATNVADAAGVEMGDLKNK